MKGKRIQNLFCAKIEPMEEKRKEKPKKHQSFLRRHWPLMVAGTVLGTQILYMLFGPVLDCDKMVIYPLINLDAIAFDVSCCITPILFFIVLAAFLRETTWREGSCHFYLTTRFLAIVLMVISFFFAYINGRSAFTASSYSQIDAEHLNNELFVLVRRIDVLDWGETIGDNYLLYRCDSIGIYCQLIHSRWYGLSDEVQLSSEPATNTISILERDEIVFTYPKDYAPIQDDDYCP